MFALALLAGAFIALGALCFHRHRDDRGRPLPPNFGLIRFAGGVTFSLGLILVVVGGAELFTGNNLIAMAWASGRVTDTASDEELGMGLCRQPDWSSWDSVLVWLAGVHTMSDGAVGETMVQIARSKIALDPVSAVARGVLCNVLVCLALWLCMGARSVTDKILAIVFPISAFVACGFEHSVANMYFLPIGMVLAAAVLHRSRHWMHGQQSRAGDDRQHPRRDSPGGLGLLVCVFEKRELDSQEDKYGEFSTHDRRNSGRWRAGSWDQQRD